MAKPQIVVLGGGFAGLETAFYLRMKLREAADITLVSDQDRFLYKPNTIYIPFGLDPEKLMIPLEGPTRRKNIHFYQAKAHEIDPEAKRVHLNGATLPYDYLVVATGAGMRPSEIPGLAEYAHTIWTPADMLALRAAFAQLVSGVNGKGRRQVLFLVPPNNKCAGPLYELVFMLDTWLRRHNARQSVEIVWSTYENSYIQAFGPRLHEVVSNEFQRRGIHAYNRYAVQAVTAKEVIYQNEEELAYDLLVSFPPYVASTVFPGLPADARGFIQTEMATRQVIGQPDIYAVGDAGNFPIKQAFLAFLQSDAAAEHLASRILGTQPRGVFEPVSMCVMEQFDKATFAQVPLRMTDSPDKPVEVDVASAQYRVGTSPAWRLGKLALSYYLPWRFHAGNPFHGGLPWRGMEVGLKAMSSVMAN
ncbi:MAG TPA: FAD-dependent oxidoreductase [Caldilineaceae bacterium]|nr:FAD-dependent oxidoreductase [Caldilineaceae bacterium]